MTREEAREVREQYGGIRLLNIKCDAPYPWDESDVDYIRVCLPVDYQNQAEMRRRGFLWADRMLDVRVRLDKKDFAAMTRMEPVLTSDRRDDILAIALESFPTDRRFHLSAEPNRKIADQVIAGWVSELKEYYLCEYKGKAIGFLALTGSQENKFIRLAAVLEAYRASGAALSLYAAAARDCQAAGIRSLYGRVSTANPAVMNLYAFLGGGFSNPMDVYLKSKGVRQ